MSGIALLDSSGLERVFAHIVPGEPDWHLPPHSHQFHELIVVRRGQLRARIGGQDYVAQPRMLMLYAAGSVHEEWAHDGQPMQTICIAFCLEGFGQREPILRRDLRGRVNEMATWLVAEQGAYSPDSDAYRTTLMRSLLMEFVRLGTQEPDAMVNRVRAYVRSHIEEPFTLQDLAEQAGVSKFHFVRRYQALTGRTPFEDARMLRVEEARRLIISSSLTLREIAPRVGVSDEYLLSRLLKRHLGVGVRELRNAVR